MTNDIADSVRGRAPALDSREAAIALARETLSGHPDRNASLEESTVWLADRAERLATGVLTLAAGGGGRP